MSLKNISMWTRFTITLDFKNRVIGGIPNDPELIKGWVQANMPAKTEEEKQKLVEATVAELPALTEDKAEKMWTTFKRDEKGIYLEGRCVKAMFKESANVIRDLLIQNEKGLKSKDVEVKVSKSRFTGLKAKLAERLYVEEDKIHIMRDVKNLEKPDGNEEKPIHIMTAMGPRTALKRFDYVEAPASVSFTVRHLNDGIVDRELIELLLEHSAWNGLGADRSQGNGLFDVRIIEETK